MRIRQGRQTGLTMLEVLVSLVVMSIGLLGLAGLQATGLRSNTGSYLRTIATTQAYAIADRMRANPLGVAAGNYDALGPGSEDPECATSTVGSPAQGCTAEQMAQYDAYAWNSENARLLPNGTGTVAVNGTLYTITVMWDDNRTGATGTGCDPTNPEDMACFRVTLQP